MMSPLCQDPAIAKLINCLVHALNIQKKLPKLKVLILDDEILQITHTTGDLALNWLYTEFERCINAKKDQVPMRCITRGGPKVITVKLCPIPVHVDI